MSKDYREKERILTDWWVRDANPIMRVIDSIDIEWAGGAKWASSLLNLPPGSLHLDIACGWGSFMAHICWRHPAASLVGLNVDFKGAHASIRQLLKKGGVEAQCSLVQSDARHMPFGEECFDSVSCFLGLQDIQIGFGNDGVCDTIKDALRVVKMSGYLFFIDTEEVIHTASDCLPSPIKRQPQEIFEPDVQWNREIAETAVALYAQGYIEQMRIGNESQKQEEYQKTLARMMADMEKQLHEKGYFNPLEPMHLIGVKKEHK